MGKAKGRAGGKGQDARRVPRTAASEAAFVAVLDAAEELFAHQGYEALAMTAIAQRAGVAKGTLYDYFDSKDAIVEKIIERLWLQLAERMQTVLIDSVGKPFEIGTPGILGTLVDFTAEHLGVFRHWALGTRHLGRFATRDALLDQCADILANRLEARKSELAVADTRIAALFLVRSSVMMLYIAVVQAPERVRDGTVRGELIRLALAYLLGRTPVAPPPTAAR